MAYNYSSASLLLLAILLVQQLSFWHSAATMFYGTASFTQHPYHSSCTHGTAANHKTFAAVPSWVYQDGAACGAKYKITCTGKACLPHGPTITVTVADVCIPDKPCEPCSDFVLSKETFRTIAGLDAATVGIYYELV